MAHQQYKHAFALLKVLVLYIIMNSEEEDP